LKESGYR